MLARFQTLRTRRDVAELLEIPDTYLIYILYRRRDRLSYRTFTIKKRSGGVRIISVPPSSLFVLQNKLNHVFQLAYRPKPSVHGFVKRRNIVSNALPHVRKRWILNVDLKDFFPSIHFGRIRGALMAKPFQLPAPAATVLAQICTAQEGLPQGAPTSPILANLVCAKLDGELMALARRYRLTYTRYCDDLSFSTRNYNFPPDIAIAGSGLIGSSVTIGPSLLALLTTNQFVVNDQKTRLQLQDCHQEVTGLTVNRFVNVPRQFVREVRAMLHAWAKFDLAAAADTYVREFHPQRRTALAPEVLFASVLRGKVEYIGFIRGRTDPVYCKLRAKLHQLDSTLIGPAPPPTARRQSSGVGSEDRWTKLFQKVRDRIVQLERVKRDGTVGSGTAFCLRDGILATAAHILTGSVTVHFPAGPASVSKVYVHSLGEEKVDCALIRHLQGPGMIPHEARDPDPGEPVAVIGFSTVPLRQPTISLHLGHVESIRTDYAVSMKFIQISVQSTGGLSGSPVLDSSGRVIGIVIQSQYEQTEATVPGREFCTVLPIGYALEIDPAGASVDLPLPERPRPGLAVRTDP